MSERASLWQRLRSILARPGPPSASVAASARAQIPDAPDVAPTRVVIGLGNPGAEYEATRHNVGFRVVDRLVESVGGHWAFDEALNAFVARCEIGDQDCLVAKPQTFMNRSGDTVAALRKRWPALDFESQMLVVFDDLDLPVGRIRLRPTGGAGGQRGMGNILDVLETRTVARLRFGIGHPGASGQVIDWVLAPFSPDDEDALERMLERSVAATISHFADFLIGQDSRRIGRATDV